MNTQHKRALLAVAAASVLSLGAASNAYADAYAIGYANFLNGQVTITPATLGAVKIDGASNTSESGATLNLLSTGDSQVLGIGSHPDAAPSCLGSAAGCANNSYTPIGMDGTNYSKGDSQFVKDQFSDGTIQVRNIAESNVVGSNKATALGSNSSQTQITFTVGLGGGTVAFAFDADPYLKAAMDSLGVVAQASLAFQITIADNLSNTVFNWQPNGDCLGGVGTCGGITGGTETKDDASLNVSRTRITAGTAVYDPTGDASFGLDGGAATANCNGTGLLCSYAAISNLLAAGTYTLTIAESKQTRVSSVPEPETIALLGLGLAGIGFMSRRRRIA